MVAAERAILAAVRAGADSVMQVHEATGLSLSSVLFWAQCLVEQDLLVALDGDQWGATCPRWAREARERLRAAGELP